jgi:hypothetical protein
VSTQYRQDEQISGWTGWVVFASIMIIIGGILWVLQGLFAVMNDEWVVRGENASLLLDITGWGWIHMLLGLVTILIGVLLFKGNMFARIVAVLIAGLSLIINFLWIPVVPLWAITIMVIDALVIYAVVAHGKELKNL